MLTTVYALEYYNYIKYIIAAIVLYSYIPVITAVIF
jgi:hypothetical protein